MADTKGIITKNDGNSVKIIRTVEQIVDYETLVTQRDAILAQRDAAVDDRAQQDKMWEIALAEIDEALGKGISEKPASAAVAEVKK